MRERSVSRRELIATGAMVLVGTACTAASKAPSGNSSRPRPDLYHCEGCDGALERNASRMGWSTYIAPANEPGEPMVIEGRVLKTDGKTPAAGVVVYAYHTNAAGVYGNGSSESEWSRRHGRLRAWVKTGSDGRYRFETIKPAPYPSRTMPAHVHLTVLEKGRRPYYIDDIVFAGEFGVTPDYRRHQEFRGGSGIVALKRNSRGRWLAVRDIVLERHPN